MDLSTLDWPEVFHFNPRPARRLTLKKKHTYHVVPNVRKVQAEIEKKEKLREKLSPEQEKEQRQLDAPEALKVGQDQEDKKLKKRKVSDQSSAPSKTPKRNSKDKEESRTLF